MKERPATDDGSFGDRPVDGKFFGTILQFYQQTAHLVRESALDADAKFRVHQRIRSRLEELSDELHNDITDPRDFDLKGRLESIYEEATRMVAEHGDNERARKNAGDGA